MEKIAERSSGEIFDPSLVTMVQVDDFKEEYSDLSNLIEDHLTEVTEDDAHKLMKGFIGLYRVTGEAYQNHDRQQSDIDQELEEQSQLLKQAINGAFFEEDDSESEVSVSAITSEEMLKALAWYRERLNTIRDKVEQ